MWMAVWKHKESNDKNTQNEWHVSHLYVLMIGLNLVWSIFLTAIFNEIG